MIRQGAAAIAALLLAACGGQQTQQSASPAPETDEGARLAFRATFLHACEAGIAGPAGQSYCSCTEDRLERSFDVNGLAKLTPDDPTFRAIARACAQKAGLPVRKYSARRG